MSIELPSSLLEVTCENPAQPETIQEIIDVISAETAGTKPYSLRLGAVLSDEDHQYTLSLYSDHTRLMQAGALPLELPELYQARIAGVRASRVHFPEDESDIPEDDCKEHLILGNDKDDIFGLFCVDYTASDEMIIKRRVEEDEARLVLGGLLRARLAKKQKTPNEPQPAALSS